MIDPAQVLTALGVPANFTGTVWNPCSGGALTLTYVGTAAAMDSYMLMHGNTPIEMMANALPQDIESICQSLESHSAEPTAVVTFLTANSTVVRFTPFLAHYANGTVAHYPLGLYDESTDMICVATNREGYTLDSPGLLTSLLHECCHRLYTMLRNAHGTTPNNTFYEASERFAQIATYATYKEFMTVLPGYSQTQMLTDLRKSLAVINQRLGINSDDWRMDKQLCKDAASRCPQYIRRYFRRNPPI